MGYFQYEEQPLIQKITREIIWKIHNNEYRPGEQLPSIEMMSKQYGVGRTTMREALRHMQSVGLIHSQHGKGTFLIEFDHSKKGSYILEQIVDVRKMLEIHAIKLAVENRNMGDLIMLSELMEEMEKSVDSHNRFTDVDRYFHIKIAEASKNPFLPNMFQNISGMFAGVQDAIVILPGSPQKAISEHHLMLEALNKRDKELAVETVTTHIESIYKQIKEIEGEKIDENFNSLSNGRKESKHDRENIGTSRK